jgi:hypothetical protein
MSTQAAISGNATKNNSSAILYGGNLSVEKTFDLGNNTQGGGSVVPSATATSGTDTALDSGEFAHQTVDQVIAIRSATSFAGIANTALLSGAGNSGRKSVNSLNSRRTVHITSWNYATGVATKGSNTTDSFGADYAADDNLAAPGFIVVMSTGKDATVENY